MPNLLEDLNFLSRENVTPPELLVAHGAFQRRHWTSKPSQVKVTEQKGSRTPFSRYWPHALS